MIIVRLRGGLGNQAYQYAAAKSLALRKNKELYIDISYLDFDRQRDYALRVFPNIKETVIKLTQRTSDELIRLKRVSSNPAGTQLISTHYYKEKELKFTDLNYLNEDIIYLDGYFQGEKYYLGNEGDIIKAFDLPERRLSLNSRFIDSIKETESVSVHFRRGDFISNPLVRRMKDNICTFQYYRECMRYIGRRIAKDLHFFIFSDELGWVKENFIPPAGYKITYVESFPEYKEATDMWLMSKCKHHIIANSTYSWWGAWLNTNNEKIICAPAKWRTDRVSDGDLIPCNWVVF